MPSRSNFFGQDSFQLFWRYVSEREKKEKKQYKYDCYFLGFAVLNVQYVTDIWDWVSSGFVFIHYKVCIVSAELKQLCG